MSRWPALSSSGEDLTQIAVFVGKHEVTTDGMRYQADLAAAGARLEPARFTIRSADDSALPSGLAVDVLDGGHVSIAAPNGPTLRLRLARAGTDKEQALCSPQQPILPNSKDF